MNSYLRFLQDGSPRVRTSLALAAVCGAASLFVGCVSEPDSHVVSAPPPPPPANTTTTTTSVVQPAQQQTTTATPVQTPQGTTMIVTQSAPPPVQQEPVLERPSDRHVWIPGYWTWRDNRYVWIAGRWEVPPMADSVWVAPRWEREGNSYRFYEGYWR